MAILIRNVAVISYRNQIKLVSAEMGDLLATTAEKFQDDFQPSLNLENQLINQVINKLFWVFPTALYSLLVVFSSRSSSKEVKDEHEKLQAFSQTSLKYMA